MPKNRIEELRKARKLSQSELANKIGVTRQAVSAYETGKRVPKPDIMDKLSEAFDVSIPYILGYTDDEAGINSEKDLLAAFEKLKSQTVHADKTDWFKVEERIINNVFRVKQKQKNKEKNELKDALNSIYTIAVDDTNSFSTSNGKSPLLILIELMQRVYLSGNEKLITSFTRFIDTMNDYLSEKPRFPELNTKKNTLDTLTDFLDEYKNND